MNEIKSFKTKQINDFMSSFDDLKEIDVNQIEEGLKNILGEKPGIDFEYGVEYELNESTNEQERIEGLKKIHIIFSYIDDVNLSPQIGRVSYIVG